jgi:hypothetical protein
MNRILHVPERLKDESFDDYKQRRKLSNVFNKLMRRGKPFFSIMQPTLITEDNWQEISKQFYNVGHNHVGQTINMLKPKKERSYRKPKEAL